MSQVLPADKIYASPANMSWTSYLPAALAIIGAFVMLLLKLQLDKAFISDGALMMIALACYILAALFQLTNLYAPSSMARNIGLWSAVLGVFFNLSSWLVRWDAAYDREIALMRATGNLDNPWIFRYIPFANLYDLSVGFAFGAGIATLLFARRKNFHVLAAFTLPLAALILTLARFIGDEFIDLPPVLDSYWRPIHVGVASLSYGVALVCFAVAVIYLLKDNAKVEAMAVWASMFAFAVIATVSKFSVFTELTYRAGLFLPNPVTGGKPFSAPFRLEIPYVGYALAVAGVLLLATTIAYLLYLYQDNLKARAAGNVLLKLSFVAQIVAIAFLVSGIRSTTDAPARLQAQLASQPAQYIVAGKAIAERQQLSTQQLAALSTTQLEQMGRSYVQQNADKLYTSLNTNPVELA
ncbi:MAG TPA: cytochrome c biogenesis protein CcsA, partial [Pyrinomonadaceae bacterium]|nr:cytochrome c biogenesis protein CcsA [Pyrinomonadaceae bacterium]